MEPHQVQLKSSPAEKKIKLTRAFFNRRAIKLMCSWDYCSRIKSGVYWISEGNNGKKTAMNRQIFHFRTWCLAFSWKRSWVGMLFGLYWKRGSLSRIEVQKCHYIFVIRWQACENVRRSMGWSECNEFLALEMRHAASLKFTSGLTHFPNYFISWKILGGRCAKDYVLTHFLFELFMIILVEIFDMFLLQCRNFPKQLLGSPQRQLSRKDEAESASYGPNMLI